METRTSSSRLERFKEWRRRGRRRADWITLRGRLLPVKDAASDAGGSDTEDDPDHQPSEAEFMDADEIEGGGMQVNSCAPQNTRVRIETGDSKEYLVNGVFMLVDPWWSVIVDVQRSGSQYFAKGYPSYELEDDMLGRESILPLFLRACYITDDHKQAFIDWLQHYTPVTFSTLKPLAAKFYKKCEINLLPYMENSSPGAFALKALETPLVLRYLPKLLPHKLRSLLMLDAHDQKPYMNTTPNKLPELESMLATEPWKLGFGRLVYQELSLYGCEATWDRFLQCEYLLEQIPDLQINALIIYNELKKKCMELGDTYVEQHELTIVVSRDMSAVNAWEAIKFLKDNGIVVIEQHRVFLYNLHCYEMDIAEYIKELVMRKTWNMDIDEHDVFRIAPQPPREKEDEADTLVSNHNPIHCDGDASIEHLKTINLSDCTSTTEPTRSTNLDDDQQKAVKMILANPVTIISGKGGCGKTTVVSQVFMTMMRKEKNEVKEACLAFEGDIDAPSEWTCDAMTPKFERESHMRTLLTAPTGKAASLLKKKTGLPAATLHQVTCSYSGWLKQDSVVEKKAWKFSKVESLVVDEGSLVSVRMFSTVLKLLYKHARLAKLVILGDVRQLPSIEPGNMLADMFAALCKMNWTIELRTNHRAESQLIVDNATWISQQTSVKFDAVVHINGDSSTEMPSEDKKFILISLANNSDSDLYTAINTLLHNGPGLQDDKHSQFISFRRNDCLLINELCCKHYSGHTIKNHKNRLEFRCSDKVCCTKNAYVYDLVTKNRHSILSKPCLSGIANLSQPQSEEPRPGLDSAEHNTEAQSNKEPDKDDRLCNGELFFIVADVEKDKIRELTLFDGQDRTYTLNYKALRSLSGLQHAWARTIHTFQGSEEDTVVYILGAAGRQNWKHVYTAVTRGRKRVYIIAQEAQLNQAIANKSRERKTRLQQRLKDVLPQSRSCSHPAASQPTEPMSTQEAGDQEPSVVLASHEPLYTALKKPPRFQCPPVPSTPEPKKDCVARADYGDCTMSPCPSPEQDSGSASTKRTGIFAVDSETPPKLCRVDNPMVFPEVSPSDYTKLQNLSIHSPCHKKLFKP